MAGTSIAKGALTLTTDASQLQSGLDKAKKQISGFDSAVNGGMKVLAFAMNPITLGLGAVGLAVMKAVNEIKEAGAASRDIINLGNTFGTTAEQAELLAYSAKDSNVEVEQLSKALRVAAQFAGEMDIANKAARDKLRPIGLEVGQLQGKDPVQALQAIFHGLRQIENKSQQLKAATDIFGERNAVQALTMMRENVIEYTDKLRDMGIALDDVTHKKLADWGDNIGRVEKQLENFKKHVLIDTIEGIDNAGEGLFGSIKRIWDEDSGDLEAAHRKLVARTKKIADERRAMAESLAGAKAAADFQAAFQDLAKAEFDLGFEAVKPAMEEAKKYLKPDALQQAQLAFQGLQIQFDEGVLNANQYSAALAQLAASLDDVKKSTGFTLPSAIVRNSMEDIAGGVRDRASLRFNPGNGVGGGMDKLLDAAGKDREDAKRREKLLQEIKEALQPVKELKGI